MTGIESRQIEPEYDDKLSLEWELVIGLMGFDHDQRLGEWKNTYLPKSNQQYEPSLGSYGLGNFLAETFLYDPDVVKFRLNLRDAMKLGEPIDVSEENIAGAALYVTLGSMMWDTAGNDSGQSINDWLIEDHSLGELVDAFEKKAKQSREVVETCYHLIYSSWGRHLLEKRQERLGLALGEMLPEETGEKWKQTSWGEHESKLVEIMGQRLEVFLESGGVIDDENRAIFRTLVLCYSLDQIRGLDMEMPDVIVDHLENILTMEDLAYLKKLVNKEERKEILNLKTLVMAIGLLYTLGSRIEDRNLGLRDHPIENLVDVVVILFSAYRIKEITQSIKDWGKKRKNLKHFKPDTDSLFNEVNGQFWEVLGGYVRGY